MTDGASRGRLRYLWVVLLSWICPGAGHVYAGSWRRGVRIFAVVTLGVLACRVVMRLVAPTPLSVGVLLGVVACILVFLLLVIIDGVRLVRHAVERHRRPWRRSVTLLVAGGVLFYVLSSLILPFDWQPFSVPSGSNIPTILVGDMFYADMTEAGRVPHRGEMMALRYPRDRRISYVKRVIGLPGDHVRITGGQLYLNSVQVSRTLDGDYEAADENGTRILTKEYTETLPGALPHHILKYTDDVRFDVSSEIDANNTPEYVVPDGHVFMLGDSRDNSSDSRFLNDMGYVPIDDLIGKATVVFFSVDHGTGVPAGRGSHWHIRWDRILRMLQ